MNFSLTSFWADEWIWNSLIDNRPSNTSPPSVSYPIVGRVPSTPPPPFPISCDSQPTGTTITITVATPSPYPV
ncbi:unnamed protein product [Nippostrongylus brasiliensis]|uniref:Uncharacterized protein n=1 Tax=Nippostrongylus brasiliensis TaxID=27835 RepID=A0A0N4Y237_NIPBR|nr:unnamed protein product [Nippostrongylus brasiliensis]